MPARPGFIGRPGWDRCNAWIWLFFVDTEDQGLVGRVDIQADDVGELLDEPRVGRQFKRPDAVRLQSMSVPNAMNRGRAQPLRGGHRPQTPVGGPRRLGVQRGVYDLLLASCGNLAFAPAARGSVGQHVGPPGGEPAAPHAHRILARAEPLSDVLARQAVSGEQHDAAPQHHALRRGAGSKPAFQRRAVRWRQWQSGGSVHAEHGTKARSEVQGDWRSLH